MILRWGRRWGASVSATLDPGRLGAESGRPTTLASEQLGRRRRRRRQASSPSPAFQPGPEAGGWDAGGQVRDSGPLLGLLQPPQSLLTQHQGPCGAVVAGTAVAPRHSPSSRHPRPRPCDEPRWLRPEGGLPGREAASRSPGRAASCGALAWRPGSQLRSGCCLGAPESRVDSPFLARAESPGRTRARAWRLLHSYRLTWACGAGLALLQGWWWWGEFSPGQPPPSLSVLSGIQAPLPNHRP